MLHLPMLYCMQAAQTWEPPRLQMAAMLDVIRRRRCFAYTEEGKEGDILTQKQKRFVEEYLIDLNATQAAIRAGYSPDTAQQMGSENLSKPVIRNAIEKAMAQRSKRTGINQERVIMEIAKLAFLNPADVIDWEAATVKTDALPEDTACIASIKVKTIPTEDGDITEREVKTYDKLKALELLGKHLGIFTEKCKVESNLPLIKFYIPDNGRTAVTTEAPEQGEKASHDEMGYEKE